MVNLNAIPLMVANPENFNTTPRPLTMIKFIVLHYTGNVGDTALNNCKYFRDTVTKSSAHFFVSDNVIYQSVPIQNAAYSVGLGSMKQPYIANPLFYKVCTNTNSVSIEMCGAKGSQEASAKTKQTACELTAALMELLHIDIDHVIRHYDVTGKSCPAWAVKDPKKWTELKTEIQTLTTEDDEMKNTEENYAVFKLFMDRYNQEVSAQPATWEQAAMAWAAAEGLINDGMPKSPITRGEMATVLQRYSNGK